MSLRLLERVTTASEESQTAVGQSPGTKKIWLFMTSVVTITYLRHARAGPAWVK